VLIVAGAQLILATAVSGWSPNSPATRAARPHAAGLPPIGLANGWFYRAASHPGAFFDVTTGNNDLAGVGRCHATVGYDLASGLGVPNWSVLPATLPAPG
jgi:hypothetical protein